MPPRVAYALFMLLALATFVLARRFDPTPRTTAGLPRWKRLALLLAAFVGGSVGAKLPFALGAPEPFLSLSSWTADGKTVVTAFAGGYFAVEAVKLALGIDAKTGDAFALPLALALAVGRWGCFLGGCCAGTPTGLPWGTDFGDGVPRHPTQIYESLFHFAMAGVLLGTSDSEALRHQRLKLYLIAYSGFRFVSEAIRPEPPWCLGLTFYQWAAAALALVLAVQWVFDERRKQPVAREA